MLGDVEGVSPFAGSGYDDGAFGFSPALCAPQLDTLRRHRTLGLLAGAGSMASCLVVGLNGVNALPHL